MQTPFGPRAHLHLQCSPSSIFFVPCLLSLHFLHIFSEIPPNSQLRPCHCDRLEGGRLCDLPPTQRGLVPCVAPDRRRKTLDEVFPGAHPGTAAALVAARDPIRAADLPAAAAAAAALALAAEVADATEVQVTVERRVREALHAARK